MMFYKNLKKIRKEKGVSQKTIAEILNTTQQQISKYEKGIQEIPTRHIITLANFYEVSTDYILKLDNDEDKINIKEKELLNGFQNLSDVDKDKILEMVRTLLEGKEELERKQTASQGISIGSIKNNGKFKINDNRGK